MKTDMKTVTINDVAKLANVSKSTVSQYLNKRYEYMGEETRERIGNAIKELGYQPNYVARSLKKKSTLTIGVIVANILHSFSTQIIRTVEDVCNENDFHVIVCNADDDPLKEKKYIEMLHAKQVDGLIVFPTGGNLELYQQMNLENYPLVFVDRIAEGFSTDTIMLDNKAAAKLAVDYFIDQGYEKIAFVTTSLVLNITSRFERINGFKSALSAHGIQVNEEYIKGVAVQEIKKELKKLFLMKEPPRALLAGNDLTLMEVLQFVREHHIKIPQDLALIAFDDVSYSSILNPPLTTISQPVQEIGRKAAEVLLTKIRTKDHTALPKVYRFQPSLIVRDSC